MMKKLMLFLFLMILIPVAIFAQEIPVPPNNWGDILMNPFVWIASFPAVSVVTAFIAASLIGYLKVIKKFYKQLVAWGVAIVILIGTDLGNIGYAKDFPLWLAALHGFMAGLASNGAQNIPWMKAMLDAIEKLFNPKVEEMKAALKAKQELLRQSKINR